MKKFEENIYLIFVLRKNIETDQETDFIIDDEYYLIEAASHVTHRDLDDKEEELKAKFPNRKILITHQPLFKTIEIQERKRKLEAELIADGLPLIHPPSTGRIADAFNWDKKIDVTRQQGRC